MPRIIPLYLLLSAVSGALAAPRIRIEAAAGADTNITRAEGDEPRLEGALLRLIADIEDARRLGDAVVGRFAYQAGAKHFFEHADEDVVFQKVSAGVHLGVRPWLRPGLKLMVEDRTSRSPLRSRDYTRVTGGPRLGAQLGPVHLIGFADGARLAYEPNPDYSATSLGGGLRFGLRLRPFALSIQGLVARREFDLDRTDDVRGIGGQIRYAGGVLASVGYDLTANLSTVTGAGFQRHHLHASSTFPIGAGLLISLKGSLQRFFYEDAQRFSTAFLNEENRSSLTARLEWSLLDSWSMVANGGAWFSPFGGGVDFDRYTMMLGLAFNQD